MCYCVWVRVISWILAALRLAADYQVLSSMFQHGLIPE